MRQGIPGWMIIVPLMGVVYLIIHIIEKKEMAIYKASFPFDVDSLQRAVSFRFTYSMPQNTTLTKGGCFVFNLDDGNLEVNKKVNELLAPSVSPKTNEIKTVAIVEKGERKSGKYSGGSTGIQHYCTIYFFDCGKENVVTSENISGSLPPDKAYVRSGGKPNGSQVSEEEIANFLKTSLQ